MDGPALLSTLIFEGTYRAGKVLHRLWRAGYIGCHGIDQRARVHTVHRAALDRFIVSNYGSSMGLRQVLEAHRCFLFDTSFQRSCPASRPGLNLRGTLMQYKITRPAFGGLPKQTHLKQLQPFLLWPASRPASRTPATTPACSFRRLQAPSYAQHARHSFAHQQRPPSHSRSSMQAAAAQFASEAQCLWTPKPEWGLYKKIH